MRDRRKMLLMSGRPLWLQRSAVWAANYWADQYYLRNLKVAGSSVSTDTRASKAYMSDASGVFSEFANDTLARVTGIGADIEGAFTNKIRNPRGEGGTVGVIGSGGVLPTNWANTASAGLSIALVGVGTEDGLPYTDIRYFGTTTSATAIKLRVDDSTNATAATGQAWGADCWVKTIAGTVPSLYSAVTSFATSSLLLEFGTGASAVPTSTKAAYSAKGVISSATANNVRASLNSAVLSNSTAYDFTLRIYAPKLVQVAVVTGTPNTAGYLPTYPILPPVGAPADSTRAADNVVTPNFTSWFGESWTNQIKYSQDFTNATWGNGAVTVTPGLLAPDGTLTASRIQNTASGNVLSQFRTIGVAGTTYTFSFYAKSNGGTQNYIGIWDRFGTGTVLVSRDFTSEINSSTFTRVSVSVTAAAGASDIYCYLTRDRTSGTVDTIVWGAQLETGSTAHTYAPTTSAAVTAYSGLAAGASELVAVTFSHVGDGLNRPLFEYYADANNYIRGYVNTADKVAIKIVTGGATQTDTALTASISAANKAYGFGWAATGGYVTNGTETVTFGAVTLPTVTAKKIGSSQTPNYLNDIIRSAQATTPLSQAAATAWALTA